MVNPVPLPWHEPLAYLDALAGSDAEYALLYSGMQTPYSGQYSILALHRDKTIEGEDFLALEAALGINLPRYANAWLGYLGYGLKHAVETVPRDAPSFIDLPALHFTRYQTVLVFDHAVKELTLHRLHPDALMPPDLDDPDPKPHHQAFQVAQLQSDMSRAEYLQKVAELKDAIAAGTLYQANLTRKFFGRFDAAPCPAKLFHRLAHVSPAPYSALLKFGNTAILSSSPERFLAMDETGKVEARPIKGSAPRFADATQDEQSRKALANSEKDKAENLMIVDLMRNDLARGCVVGSVKTEALFEISTYATVHHMSSTISGRRKPDIPPLRLVASCFPPGSMTGAPKIKAMELCSALEPRARGVYSGAIGWFGGDGACDLSVVIRTLVMQENRFEFQVGGAIIHDSTPEGEWEETLTKARGLAGALHIDMERLRAL